MASGGGGSDRLQRGDLYVFSCFPVWGAPGSWSVLLIALSSGSMHQDTRAGAGGWERGQDGGC